MVSSGGEKGGSKETYVVGIAADGRLRALGAEACFKLGLELFLIHGEILMARTRGLLGGG